MYPLAEATNSQSYNGFHRAFIPEIFKKIRLRKSSKAIIQAQVRNKMTILQSEITVSSEQYQKNKEALLAQLSEVRAIQQKALINRMLLNRNSIKGQDSAA